MAPPRLRANNRPHRPQRENHPAFQWGRADGTRTVGGRLAGSRGRYADSRWTIEQPRSSAHQAVEQVGVFCRSLGLRTVRAVAGSFSWGPAIRRARLSEGGKPSKSTAGALENLINTTIVNYLERTSRHDSGARPRSVMRHLRIRRVVGGQRKAGSVGAGGRLSGAAVAGILQINAWWPSPRG